MAHFVGLDVSVKETAVCVVDEVGEVYGRVAGTKLGSSITPSRTFSP